MTAKRSDGERKEMPLHARGITLTEQFDSKFNQWQVQNSVGISTKMRGFRKTDLSLTLSRKCTINILKNTIQDAKDSRQD